MKKTAAAIVASVCLALAASAGAEIQPKMYTVSPFVGGYKFEGDEHLKTAPVVGARLGYDYTKKFGVEGLVDATFSNTTDGLPNRDVSLFSLGLEGLYYFRPDSRLVPFLAGGLRGYVLDDANGDMNRNRFGVSYGVGAKYFLKENWALRGDVRHLVFFDQGWSNLEATLGLSYVFGQKVAPPPPPPPPAPAPAPVAPPPPPPPATPKVSLSANPASIEAGKCSELGWSSSNASNVTIDQGIGGVTANGSRQVCPTASTSYTATASGPGGSATSAASVSVSQPPPPQPPAAPSVSISANPATIQRGQCSNLSWNSSNAANVTIDQGVGAVGVSGSKSVCPVSDTSYTVTGTGPGGTRTASSAVSVTVPPPPPPPPAPKEPTKEELTIVLNIEFDTDKAVILPKYEPEVARVAEFMKKYPQVKGVIEGHTDNVGGKAYNDKLSLKRANIVKKQLVDKYSVDGSRLSTSGFGFSKPVGDNGTPEGRQKNRRIVANFDKVTIIKP